MQSLNELKAGRFLGRYELLTPIAQGGMAAVWAARLQGTRGFQKVVAIKTILPTLSDDPRFEQMFLDEAGLAAGIRHSNVVQVLDLGEDQGVLYQVMEWIDGPPLNQLLREATKGSGLPRAVAAKIMIGVCEGLHAAHELRDDSGTLVGLVHRDISPQNILVSIDGVPKVTDFGVAKATSLSSARTATGTFKGKPAYMAPEQILGGNVDRRADVFSLGIVLYLLTTTRHPFRGDTDMATLHRVVDPKPPARPSEFDPNFPSGLEFVIMKALAKAQNERFATAADMARALHQAMPEVHEVGDTDVAQCVREFSGPSLRARAEAIKSALAAADARTPMSGRGSSPSNVSADAPQIEVMASELDGEQASKNGLLTPSETSTPYAAAGPSPAPRSKFLPVVFGGIALLAVAALIGVIATRRTQPQILVVSAPASASATAAAPAASSEAPAESSSAPAAASSSPVSADTLPRVPADTEQPRTAGGHKARDAGAASADTPAPKSTSTSKGYVPSVRDPGF